MSKTAYRTAVHDSIRDAMVADPRVVLMGEDVGAYGGTYAVSKGLLEEFGPGGCETPRCRSSASWVSESVPHWADCARSSR